MKLSGRILFIIFLFSLFTAQAQDDVVTARLHRCVPDDFLKRLKDSVFVGKYELSDFINPFYITGDFNGDKHQDILIAIKEIATDKKGLILLHGHTHQHFVFGAGTKFGTGGDDFSWLHVWKLCHPGSLHYHPGKEGLIKLKHDGIILEKSETASGLIYWSGKEYHWVQMEI